MEKQKLTIYDIARELNISIATVSRALNGKLDVSEETRKKIFQTAKEMGYKASKTASSLSRKEKRFVALFPDYELEDYDKEVQRGIMKAVDDLSDYHLHVEFESVERDYIKFVEKIQELSGTDCSGVIVSPPDGESRISEYLKQVNKGKLPMVTVVSDLNKSSRLFCVQNNNYVAGRMAGELLGSVLGPGKKVALLTGFVSKEKVFQVHRETEQGFKDEIKEQGLNLVGVYEHHDVPSEAYVLADQIITEHPDLDGIYLATANSITFCERLKELGAEGRFKIVASDIFAEMIEFIRSGLVMASIFQNPFEQGRLATRYLFEYLVEQREFETDRILLDPQFVMKSNVGLYEKRMKEWIERFESK